MKIAGNGLDQLLHEITIYLKKRPGAHTKSFVARLVLEHRVADGVPWNIQGRIGGGRIGKKGHAFDLRSFRLERGGKVVQIGRVGRDVNFEQHFRISVVGKKFDLTDAGGNFAHFAQLPDVLQNFV